MNKAEVIKKYGPWTAHNILLKDGSYTRGEQVYGDEIKLRRVLQMASDLSGGSLQGLKVLDLACLEGLYAVEFARQGARVVGIEGRQANIEKARFAKEDLGLSNLELVLDDVRNLSLKKYGAFDIVLCLGILYHLDWPDVFDLLRRISEVCGKFAVIDTQISLKPKRSVTYNGQEYWGRNFMEHRRRASREEKERNAWASLEDPNSFWPTLPSLLNLLSDVGFTSVYECHNPPELQKPRERITLLALKGSPGKLNSAPLVNELPEERWPEERRIKWPKFMSIPRRK